jgi:hypothetical protein
MRRMLLVFLVPTLGVGTHVRTLCVPYSETDGRDAERRQLAFPRGAWERGPFSFRLYSRHILRAAP